MNLYSFFVYIEHNVDKSPKVSVYSQHEIEHKNTHCEQNVEDFIVNATGTRTGIVLYGAK